MRKGVWWLMWSKCVCRNRHRGQTLNTQRMHHVYRFKVKECFVRVRVFCLCLHISHVLSGRVCSNREFFGVSKTAHCARPWKKTASKASVLHVYIGHQLKKCKEWILCERPFIFVSVCLNIVLCLYCTGCFETPKNWSLNTDAQF